LDLLRRACADEGVAILGGLPALPELAIPERHLGLHLVAEGANAPVDAYARAAEEHLDLDGLLERLGVRPPAGPGEAIAPRGTRPAGVAPPEAAPSPAGGADERAISAAQSAGKGSATTRCRIAVARDAAFAFYYEDNLELLQAAGAELIEWSPLATDRL